MYSRFTPVSQYRHNVGEDNADAHMKRQIMGRENGFIVTGMDKLFLARHFVRIVKWPCFFYRVFHAPGVPASRLWHRVW